jgi:hypothetical protein
MRAYIAIEAVLVHAEIRRGVAEANEARRARHGGENFHQRLHHRCGSGRSGTSCHSVLIIRWIGEKDSMSFGSDCGETGEGAVDCCRREGQVSAHLESFDHQKCAPVSCHSRRAVD